MSEVNQYDAIIIGSGIGGLTVAAILSKLNRSYSSSRDNFRQR
jgi:choline dehydrogenase-like flavoprotein